MKKRTTRAKTAPKKSTRSHTRKASQSVVLLPFSFRRIILVTSCILLFIVVVALSNRGIVTQSVAGLQITRGMFNQQTVDLPQVIPTNVTAYNIYYKEKTDSKYMYAVRKISTSVSKYTISYLKKNKEYEYVISGLNSSGKEIWWSETKTFFSYQTM